MKIKQIKIEKLFGLEKNDFDINFEMEEVFEDYIRILYSFTGSGKTTCLRLIDAVLNLKMFVLDSIPFKKVKIIFDDQSYIFVEKNGEYRKPFKNLDIQDLIECPTDKTRKIFPISYSVSSEEKTNNYYLRMNDNCSPRNVNFDLWTNLEEYFNKEDLDIFESLKTSLQEDFYVFSIFSDDKIENVTTSTSSKYAFFDRQVSYAEQEWRGQDSKIKCVCNGLKAIEKDKSKIAGRFIDLINNEFSLEFKTLALDETEGLKVIPDESFRDDYSEKYPFDLSNLSNNEKNLIFMFYKLMVEPQIMNFKNKNCQRIMLLDDETSMHIDFQKKILENMEKVCKENNIQLITATSSPSFVEEYLCLLVPMQSMRYEDA